nr:hypothetical protein [Tanacetum cinerariifolium]
MSDFEDSTVTYTTEDEEQDEDDDMRRRSTQLRPTLFHLHLHSVSRLGYLPDPSRRYYSSLRRMLRESSTAAAARPIEGYRADYGFVGSIEAKIRRRIAEDIRYGIRDTWIDPRDVAEEEALTNLEGEAIVSREAWAHSIGLSSAVHFELQGYMTHTWVQDQRIDAQDVLIATLTTQLSLLQGHLATALGEIRALQAREQARTGAPEGAGSST